MGLFSYYLDYISYYLLFIYYFLLFIYFFLLFTGILKYFIVGLVCVLREIQGKCDFKNHFIPPCLNSSRTPKSQSWVLFQM